MQSHQPKRNTKLSLTEVRHATAKSLRRAVFVQDTGEVMGQEASVGSKQRQGSGKEDEFVGAKASAQP